MDSRNLIFPMTAGDLVQSAVVLGCKERGDGVEIALVLEVTGIEWEGDPPPEGGVPHPSQHLSISFQDRHTFERSTIRLKADTPILITNISWS